MAGRIFWITAGTLLLAVVLAVTMGWWPAGVESIVAVAVSLLALCYGLARSLAKNLWQRWQERLTERIDTAVLRMTSRFDRHYREFVLNSVRFVDLKGLTTIGFHTPEIEEVFVDVTLTRRAASRVEEGLVAPLPARIERRHSLGELIAEPGGRILGIIGVPGCGKTTLLRHTARTVCRGTGGRSVPILLYLRDHTDTILERPEVGLLDLVRPTLGRYAEAEPAGWFEQRLEEGRCVVLLDGLDEVARREDRRDVADWIERQTAQYPDNVWVITARPRGYRRAPISGAEIYQVRGFRHSQVVRFVRGWYLAAEVHATGSADDHTRHTAREGADDLLERLNALPALYELTSNPLLLTMIANVHRDRGALPGSRAGLYSEICQVMLWRRQEAKKLEVMLTGPRKEFLLRGLAFAMMRQQVRDLPRERVYEEFDALLSRMPEEVTAADILVDVRDHGLLIERKDALYAFTHHTFQEYLAAAHIRDKGLVRVLEEAVDDPWWRETTVLYAAMADADSIVRACLESGSVAALSLAFDCAEGGRELAPEYRRRLDDLLASTLTPDTDTELRRVMVRVLMARHARTVVRTAGGARVCTLPVTERIYRLFLDETGHPSPHFSSGADDDPVTDIGLDDASAFTRWVNEVTDGEPGYHLPTRAELDDPTVRGRIPTCSAWVSPEAGQGGSLLWTPKGTRDPHTVDATTVADHLRADVDYSPEPLSRLLLLRSIVLLRVLGDARSANKRLYIDYVERLDRAFDRGAHREGGDLVNVADALTDAQDAMTRVAADLERTMSALRGVRGATPFDHGWALSRVADLKDARLLTEYEYELAEDLRSLGRALWRTVDELGHGHPLDTVLGVGEKYARHDAGGGAEDEPGYSESVERVLGRAVSDMVDRTLVRGEPGSWQRRWHAELIRASGLLDEERFLILPATLSNGARNAEAALTERLPGTWLADAAGAFAELAAPALEWPRHAPITDRTATVLRLGALCLAAEAGAHGHSDLRGAFLKLAAGVTFLQRRARDEGSITQTIVLAIA
ncbi:NACHT domain-containing protein [Saccharomonospora saliphila]|uniref:NACHT domain-containing protein n=1 Tax=Saccharomonospora saliphila TaxID=369829 RepID=UPI0003817323|nr:NACHT domain-containing protein [Saccharomonospora saliphila]